MVVKKVKLQHKTGFNVIFMVYLSILPLAAAVKESPSLFKLSDLSGALSFRYQVTDENEGISGTPLRDLNRKYLEGGIQLNLGGSIYHPNLLAFRVSLNIVGYRSKYLFFSDPSVNNAINNTHNINLSFFKEKKLNLELYTLSNFATADRAFLDRYFTTLNSIGLRVNSRLKILPFDLDVYNTRMKSESLTYSERDETSQNIDLRLDVLSKPRSRSILTFRRRNYSEAVYEVDYRSLEMMLNYDHRYGIKDMNLLSSTLNYNRMSGDYDLEVLNFRANALHYLRRNLFLNGTYMLSVDNSFDRTFRRHEFNGRVNHQLYDSLISSLLLGGRIENSTFQKVNTFRNQVSFNYRKTIPTGRILLNYVNRNERANTISQESITGFSELFDFSLTDTIMLTRPGIEIDSITVTEPNLSYFYIAGIDYQVNIVNHIVTITRLPGGAIPAGAEVLVQFQYLSYPDFRLKTHFYQINCRVNFLKYFYLLFIRSSNNQAIESDYTIPPYENYDKTVWGGQLVSRLLNLDYMVEKYDSNLTDYNSRSLRLSGHIGFFRQRLKLSANLNLSRLNYEPVTFFTRFDAYSFECMCNPQVNLTASALYRRIKYATPDYSRDRESLLFKFQWKFRKIILDIFFEHILTVAGTVERGHSFFSVMIRRLF